MKNKLYLLIACSLILVSLILTSCSSTKSNPASTNNSVPTPAASKSTVLPYKGFQGTLSGTFSGTAPGAVVNGTFTATVDAQGVFTGSFLGTYSGALNGNVDSNGNFSASGMAGADLQMEWQGTLSSSGNIQGTWEVNDNARYSGTFSGPASTTSTSPTG